MLLDQIMPEYEFNERHERLLSAPAERALEAVKQATPGEMPLVRLLFARGCQGACQGGLADEIGAFNNHNHACHLLSTVMVVAAANRA